MKELLEYLAKSLVSHPEQVRVAEKERNGAVVLQLSVAPDDLGKVIGRGGRIARAMRTVVKATAVKRGERVIVEILD